MSSKRKIDAATDQIFPKVASGIRGLDEITFGGLPKGRPTLIAGGPGSGKTLMSMEFLVRGATDYKEPGIFMAFEEIAEELAENVASLGTEESRKEEIAKLQRDLERHHNLMDAQVAAIQAEYSAKEDEFQQLINQEKKLEKAFAQNREEMGRMRKEDKST